MSKVQMLRAFVNQRLTAAADEIFELFERTIAEYEEELYRSTENHRQRKLLDDIFNLEVRSHRAEPPHVKEEQEELWTSQEGEQLFTSVPVKSEEEEVKPQCSQLHERQTEQMETEADGEDCGGPEPTRNLEPDTHLQPATHDKTSHSESETDDSRDWEEPGESQSGLNSLQNNEVPVSNVERNSGKTSVSSSECARSLGHKGHLQKRTEIQTGKKPFSCSVCGKRFAISSSLISHSRVHSDGKRLTCSVCKLSFGKRSNLIRHMRVHTGEKPFSCSVCGTRFTQKGDLSRHLKVHTGEKPLSCSICSKRFSKHSNLTRHLTLHTGEKPFCCSVCNRQFNRLYVLKKHKCVGESSRKK